MPFAPSWRGCFSILLHFIAISLERHLVGEELDVDSFGLNDVEWFRLGRISEARRSEPDQRCHELGSRVIVCWVDDLEAESIKVAE